MPWKQVQASIPSLLREQRTHSSGDEANEGAVKLGEGPSSTARSSEPRIDLPKSCSARLPHFAFGSDAGGGRDAGAEEQVREDPAHVMLFKYSRIRF